VLQDDLGDFQDLQVQSEEIERIAAELVPKGTAPPETFMAMGRLVEMLHWRSLRARERFGECFGAFSRPGNRRLFRRLFRDAAKRARRGAAAERAGDGQGDRTEVPRPE